MFEAWQLGMIDEAGYNGIRKEHIDEVINMILSSGITVVDGTAFEDCCYRCGIDPDNFTQADLDKFKDRLDDEGIESEL